MLLDPSGDVARQQSDLMIASAVLMSLIIVPVLVAIGVIAWRYRASNKNARYEPEWEHSTGIELVVWAAPLLIIIALGAMTWIGTHQLDPYRPLSRIDDGKSLNVEHRPLEVEVVSLEWKWLFIYPQYGIATVNDLAAPVNVPIHFKLTANTMMDSFFVPALSGQIYTMPGMQTVLNAVINKPGTYRGFSANYIGPRFHRHAVPFPGHEPGELRPVGGPGPRRRQGPGPRDLRPPAQAFARRAGAPVRPLHAAPVQPHPQSLRGPREDVPEPDDGDRRPGR